MFVVEVVTVPAARRRCFVEVAEHTPARRGCHMSEGTAHVIML